MVPELRTARLTLRGFRESDLDGFAAMQADPEVMRHLGAGDSAGRPRTRAESWAAMAQFMGQWALRGRGIWAVEREGRFVGRLGILEPEGWPAPELAYALAREAWGQGLAFEGCQAALGWARAALPGAALASFIRPDNAPSRRLAARLGATLSGPITLLGVTAERWDHA